MTKKQPIPLQEKADAISLFREWEREMGEDHPKILEVRKVFEEIYDLPPRKFH